MSKIVSLHYSPQRWNQLVRDEGNKTLAKGAYFNSNGEITSKFNSRAESRESLLSSPHVRPYTPSIPIPPINENENKNQSLNLEQSKHSIEDCLTNMLNYRELSLTTDQEKLENDWYNDLHSVAQRLHMIRECYKVVQSVNRKKNMQRHNSNISMSSVLNQNNTPITSDVNEEEEEEEEEDELVTSQNSQQRPMHNNSQSFFEDHENESSGSNTDMLN